MKKLSVVILVLFIFAACTGLPDARDKTMPIGKTTWYTEQNPFEELLKIAQEENKPIFAFFSATWCRPCQHIKKHTFSKDEFQKVANEVVLLYIEQTDPKGREYCKKHKVLGFPTFKIFSKNGIELETGFLERTVGGGQKRTVEDFLEWVTEVKAGNNYYALLPKIKKEPNNRELLLEMEKKLNWSDYTKKNDLLRRVIKMNPDFNDPLSHEAYEKMVHHHCWNLFYRGNDDDKRKYARENHQEVIKIFNAYYPGKLQYSLKETAGFVCIISWFNGMGDYQKALKYFDDFLKTRKNQVDLQEDVRIFPEVVFALLHGNREKDAEKWLVKLQDLAKNMKDQQNKELVSSCFTRVFQTFIDYYGEKGLKKEAEKYAGLWFAELSKDKDPRTKKYIENMRLRYAQKYYLFTGEVAKKLEKELAEAGGAGSEGIGGTTCDLARLYVEMGKKDAAKKLLFELYQNKTLMESLRPNPKAALLNKIAGTMVETKIAEKKTLEIAKEAVALREVSKNLDTLAEVHAALGNFKEAVKIEEKALKKAKHDYYIEMYREKVDKWQKMLIAQ